MITDPSLGDFQYIHPEPAAKAGDYTFSFTPATSGPHRIWADIVPAVTGLQELPSTDIGGTSAPVPPRDTADVLTTTADGFNFQIAFSSGNGGIALARQIQLMKVNVTDSSGQPVTRLEPFLNAFAHVTGIYADQQTVVRIHPTGGDVLRDEVRGGPLLGFKFYFPRTGYIRLYCQVRIDGRLITAPFSVNVSE